MSKREVWVVEGRRKGRERELWRPQTAPVERGPALDRLTLYSERNNRYEFRVTRYVPDEQDADAATIRYGNKRAFQPK